jgi:hypothetical protein
VIRRFIRHACIPCLAAVLSLAPLLSLGDTAASAIPYRAATSDPAAPTATQWLGVGAACAVLLVVLVVAVRRGALPSRMGVSKRQHLRVVERLPVAGSGTQLLVVEYEQRRLLLAVAAGHACCLRDDPMAEGHRPELPEGGSV